MVTARASAPARLTQQQVDDLRAGRAVEAAARPLHAVRRPSAAKSRTMAGSTPLPLTADDLQAISRQGAAPEHLSALIAALARPAAPKGSAAAARKRSAPHLKRPNESSAD